MSMSEPFIIGRRSRSSKGLSRLQRIIEEVNDEKKKLRCRKIFGRSTPGRAELYAGGKIA